MRWVDLGWLPVAHPAACPQVPPSLGGVETLASERHAVSPVPSAEQHPQDAAARVSPAPSRADALERCVRCLAQHPHLSRPVSAAAALSAGGAPAARDVQSPPVLSVPNPAAHDVQRGESSFGVICFQGTRT